MSVALRLKVDPQARARNLQSAAAESVAMAIEAAEGAVFDRLETLIVRLKTTGELRRMTGEELADLLINEGMGRP